MAFAQTTTATVQSMMANKRVAFGKFTQGSGDTGGAIVTGLQVVEYFECTGMKTASVSGGTVTATTLDPGGSQAGYWMAIGR